MERMMPILIGILFVAIGVSNRKGNISLLHSYHRHRVLEEDKLPMGKLIGLGMIIIGVTVMLIGVLPLVLKGASEHTLALIESILTVVGFIPGLGLNLYAIIKYNKGLF